MSSVRRSPTILLSVAIASILSGCLASTGAQPRPEVRPAQPPAEAMVPCDAAVPPLRGSGPSGAATAGDVLLWRRVDLQRYVEDCRKRHSDLIEFEAKRLGENWLPPPEK